MARRRISLRFWWHKLVPPAPVNRELPPANGAARPASPGSPVAALVPPPTPGSAAPAPVPAAATPAATPATPGNVPAAPTVQPQIVYNVMPAPPANNGFLQIQGMQGESVPWSIVVLLTVLTLIPSILLCITPFARLLIVFHFLRQALGLQTTPSNQTLIGLSLILTFFLMQPVGQQIFDTAIVPMQSGKITAMEALTRSEAPMRKFMSHYVREKDVALFITFGIRGGRDGRPRAWRPSVPAAAAIRAGLCPRRADEYASPSRQFCGRCADARTS